MMKLVNVVTECNVLCTFQIPLKPKGSSYYQPTHESIGSIYQSRKCSTCARRSLSLP